MKKIFIMIVGLATGLTLATAVSAQIDFQVIHEFDGVNGANAPGHLIYHGGRLYGMTAGDTVGNHGVIFSILPDGSGFTLIHRFAGQPDDGTWPHGSLNFFNDRLYGLTWAGGCDELNCPENLDYNGCGTAFSLQTGGEDYTVLWEFACGGGDLNASLPNAYFISDGDKLYSTTQTGGDSYKGTVFSINPDGTEFTVLHNFSATGPGGDYPAAGLVLDGETFYGTTSQGGADDRGTIFSLRKDGTDFTVLHTFYNTNENMPFSAPIIVTGRIFGTTPIRGLYPSDRGVVFSLNTDGTDYTVLHYFSEEDGSPMEGVVMAGDTLYGATLDNSPPDYGVIYSVNADGSDYTVLHRFDGDDGFNAYGKLLLVGNTFYGMAGSGGSSNCGVIFSLTPPGTPTPLPWPMFRHDERHTGLSRYTGPQRGSLAWSYETGYFVPGSPSIGQNETLYIGSYDNNVYALDSPGTLRWSYGTGNWVDSCPAVDADGRLYVGSQDNALYALASSGGFLWSYVTGDSVESSPVIGLDGRVYVGSADNNVYAFSSSGVLIWSYETGYWIETSPALGDGERVYVGSDDFNIYALTSAGGLEWSYRTGAAAISEPAVGADGVLYEGSNDYNMYAINSTGSLLWTYDANLYGQSIPAIGAEGSIYFGSFDANLYALTSAGLLAWTYETDGQIVSGPAVGADGKLYFGSYDGTVYALNSDGNLTWSYATGNRVFSSPAIGSSGRLYVGGDDNNIYCFQDRALAAPLALMKNDGGDYNLYGYNLPVAGDWNYWDAASRNPSPLGRDFWVIPSGNNTVAMTEVDADDAGEQELAVLKAEQGGVDQNIYFYNVPVPGDWAYWDAVSRNPSPLARDFWMIPSGNDTVTIADGGSHIASMKNPGGDYNLYLSTSPAPGDWIYWDAAARNPSPLARDLWVIPGGNDAVAMCGLDTVGDGDVDSLQVVRNQGGDYTVYLWNMLAPGDWTYWDAIARNPSARAKDLWVVPARNDIEQVVGVGRDSSPDELAVMENYGGDYNFYVWNAPVTGDWAYWDAVSRNPSPLARDFWMIPSGNDTVGVAAPQ